MEKIIFVILVVLAFTGTSSCANTQCGAWNKGSDWRCAKDNSPGNQIHIESTCDGCTVNYMVGMWHSPCHKKGTLDKNEPGSASDSGTNIDFPAADRGK